ncbi:MAG: winged helix-turn-helix transcriptional regulator [Candidatus Aenigmarchaeota archaeon]|nr:winged helix-turn-helix transcriptional regulator [Candidatus Aenigmarchaeota archaeon]
MTGRPGGTYRNQFRNILDDAYRHLNDSGFSNERLVNAGLDAIGLFTELLKDMTESLDYARPRETEQYIGDIDTVYLDAWQEKLYVDRQERRISPLSFELLYKLMERQPRVVSHGELSEVIFGEPLTDHSITTHIWRIRQRISPYGDAIETLQRRGYSYVYPCNTWSGELQNIPANDLVLEKFFEEAGVGILRYGDTAVQLGREEYDTMRTLLERMVEVSEQGKEESGA